MDNWFYKKKKKLNRKKSWRWSRVCVLEWQRKQDIRQSGSTLYLQAREVVAYNHREGLGWVWVCGVFGRRKEYVEVAERQWDCGRDKSTF